MPYDPCGMICGIGRYCYTTKMRPFRDSDLEVDIVWYPADPDAIVLPFPSVVTNLEEMVMERSLGIYAGWPVGEVPGALRPYNAQTVKPLTGRGRYCGTPSMFRNGAYYDPDVNRPKRPDGLPLCCGEIPGLVQFTYQPFGLFDAPQSNMTYQPSYNVAPWTFTVTGWSEGPVTLVGTLPATFTWSGETTNYTYVLTASFPFWPAAMTYELQVFDRSPTPVRIAVYFIFSYTGTGPGTLGLSSGSGPATLAIDCPSP